MLVKAVTFNVSGGISTFAAAAHTAAMPERAFTAFIRLHKTIHPPETLGDPFLAAFLIPAMFLGEELTVQAPVSRRLFDSLATVQNIIHRWFPATFGKVAIHAAEVLPTPGERAGRGMASFFSGGVDSWYSLLRHPAEIAALVTVKGFDIPLHDETVFRDLADANRRIAAEVGKEFVAVETNLRQCLDPQRTPLGKPFVGDFWGYHLHGALLAAVGLCLQRHYSGVIVPSSWPYHRLQPWGTHPLLDPLWSTGWTEFIHDGCESDRLDKLRVVAQSPNALRHLRVCPTYTPGRYNCGECEKCRRTMLTLKILGALESATSFDRPFHLASLMAGMQVPRRIEGMYRDMLAESIRRGQSETTHFLRVILGDEFHFPRAWSAFRTRCGLMGDQIVRLSGIQRHLRSIRKRWCWLRGKPV